MGKTLDFFEAGGRIDDAKHCAACGYKCCNTGGNNFIVLFPFEIDAARVAGLSMGHLEIAANNPGIANCIRSCFGDNDYKPINCALYPIYPVSFDLSKWARGARSRCPISDARLVEHLPIIIKSLLMIEKNHPGSIKFLVDSIKKYPGDLVRFNYSR